MPERQEDKPTLLETAKEKLNVVAEKASGAVGSVKQSVFPTQQGTPAPDVSTAPVHTGATTDLPREQQHGYIDTVKEKYQQAVDKASEIAGSVKDTVWHKREAPHAAEVSTGISTDSEAKARDLSTEQIASLSGQALQEHAEAMPEHSFDQFDKEQHAKRSVDRAAQDYVASTDLPPSSTDLPATSGTPASVPTETAGEGYSYTQRMKEAAGSLKEHVAAAAEAVKHTVWVTEPKEPEKQVGKLPGEMNIDKQTEQQVEQPTVLHLLETPTGQQNIETSSGTLYVEKLKTGLEEEKPSAGQLGSS
eukprot:jgi/Mesvir1/12218/Mv00446-RA.1